MYDSFTAHLKKGQYTTERKEFFDGRNTKLINGRFDVGSSFVSRVREQARKNKKYYPVISLSERTFGSYKTEKRKEEILEIQMSMPKARYETNKYEIDQNDYGFIARKGVDYLGMAGISTSTDNFKNAILDKLDICKSITLPPYFGITEQVIKKLSPFNYKPKSDFRCGYYDSNSGGIFIKFYNPIRGWVVYCKYSEILNNGYTLVEEEIKRQVLTGIQPKNLIRFELSLQTKQSLEAVLRRFIPNKKKGFTLNDVFTNGNISQKILLEEFDKIYNPLSITLITLSEMKESQLDYILRNKINNLKDRALMSYLVNMTTKIGLAKTLELAKRETSNSSYERIKKSLPKIRQELGEIDETTLNLIEFLRGELVKFELIKPEVEKGHCQPLLIEI